MASNLTTYIFPDKPHQPNNFIFPKRPFGKKEISASMLHYDEALDVAFCHLCGKEDQEKNSVPT